MEDNINGYTVKANGLLEAQVIVVVQAVKLQTFTVPG